MTIRQVVAVGLRFFAIWLCFNALGGFLFMLKAEQANGLGSTPGASYILGSMLALAVVVWMAAPYIGGAMVSGLRQSEPSQLSLADLVTAGCVLLGLWWLKEGVAGLTYTWLRAQMISSVSGQSAYASMDAATRAQAGYHLGEALLAAWLLARPFVVPRWVLGRARVENPSDA
jgi:hypothetical protein